MQCLPVAQSHGCTLNISWQRSTACVRNLEPRAWQLDKFIGDQRDMHGSMVQGKIYRKPFLLVNSRLCSLHPSQKDQKLREWLCQCISVVPGICRLLFLSIKPRQKAQKTPLEVCRAFLATDSWNMLAYVDLVWVKTLNKPGKKKTIAGISDSSSPK